MSLFIPALWYAINARLSADTTLTALLGSNGANNIVNTFPPIAVDPPGTSYPLVVFKFVSADTDDALRTRRYDMMFEVHLFVSEKSTSDSLLLMSKIHERVLGDWPESSASPPVPAYGLDRWQADFTSQSGDYATSYSPEIMEHTSTIESSSDDDRGLRQWIMTFKVALDYRQVPA
jgi:hypothetical protein